MPPLEHPRLMGENAARMRSSLERSPTANSPVRIGMELVDSTNRAEQVATVRFRPLVVVLAAVCLGITADRYASAAIGLWWSAIVVALVVWFVIWCRGRDRSSALCLLIAVTAAAGAWHHLRWSMVTHDDLAAFARDSRQPTCIEVIALGRPRRLPAPDFDPLRAIPAVDRSRLEVRAVRLRDGRRWKSVSGRATLLVDGHVLGVRAGDRLRLFAQLSAPREKLNPGEFDRVAHARAEGRRSLLAAGFPDCVSVIRAAGGASIVQAVDALRASGDELLWRHVSHARSPLAMALLLGRRGQLPRERTEAFFETGTIHLLAISGLHVGILAASLFGVLRLGFLPRNLVLISIAAITVLYSIVTDAHAPVMRATVLVLIVCGAVYLGRRPTSFNSIAAAALVVLIWNPADLFRAGAQLSFLAVATIAWLGARWSVPRTPDPLARLIAQTRPWPARCGRAAGRWLFRLALVSAAIWLVTLPLVMACFHLVSPVAVVLSPLLWIPVAGALLSGFAVLVFGWLIPPLADICGAACDLNLTVLEQCVATARDVPGSHFWAPGPAGWWLVVFYGALASSVAFPRLRPPRRWCLAVLAVWVTVGMVPGWAKSLQQPRLECGFVSIGHGSAVVLELPDGRTLLYDAGTIGSPRGAARTIADYLWSRGITHLDAVVLSHADVDHYCAMPELFERFSVGVVYVSPVMFERRTAALAALAESIEAADVPLRTIHSGQRLRAGDDCQIEVLHPPRRGVIGSDNANSIVLAVEYAGHRILLPGDLETSGLDAVLAEVPWDCDVLLAPHHGSRLSNPSGFAAWCTPEWVVISGGHGRDVTAVEQSYRAAGAQVLHTAEAGAVTVTLDAGGVVVQSYRQPAE